jgi:hypothetical protein
MRLFDHSNSFNTERVPCSRIKHPAPETTQLFGGRGDNSLEQRDSVNTIADGNWFPPEDTKNLFYQGEIHRGSVYQV